MSDGSAPTSPDTPAEEKALVPLETPAIVSPVDSAPPYLSSTPYAPAPPVALPASASPTPAGTPLFWLLGFLAVFVIDAILVVVLLALHQDLAVALGVPGALTAVALGVLSAVAGHMGRRG
ncbi:hypothetical protein [Amycolatopsis sp. cg9]|uniref:hypothetical protein n=1 Tax=Amycolatopsis sp. cg9 TaxID=3238801 RepID=UPI003524B31C